MATWTFAEQDLGVHGNNSLYAVIEVAKFDRLHVASLYGVNGVRTSSSLPWLPASQTINWG